MVFGKPVKVFRTGHHVLSFTVANGAFDAIHAFGPNARALGVELQRDPAVFITTAVVEGEASSLKEIR